MTQERATQNDRTDNPLYQKVVSESYYGLLGLHPSASVREIRQAYRDLSKLYHPDTTTLPTTIATDKFQQLNEAYATLSSPERRSVYDRKIGYSSVAVVQPLPTLHRPASRTPSYSSSAYLDATDRPLSPGEIFALFILGITFLGCLVLAIAIGLTRGDSALQPVLTQAQPIPQVIIPNKSSKITVDSPKLAEETTPAAPPSPVKSSKVDSTPRQSTSPSPASQPTS